MMNQGQYVVRARTIALLAGIFCLFLTVRSWGDDLATPFVGDELLLQHKVGVSEAQIADILNGQGATTVDEIQQLRVKRIKVPVNALEKVKAALARNPHVSFVENNYFAEATAIPNDPLYPSQWHLPKISAPQGWDISSGAPDVVIAIADSGIDPTHPDLSAKLVAGYNFVAGNTDTHDVYGHGTKVAGAAAALCNNLQGGAGVACQNPVMPLVIADSAGYATYFNMAQAMTYSADHGAKVINISYAGTSSSSTLQNAATYAWNKGVVIFASAGNYSTSTPYYPAACTNVVAVSSTSSSDTLSSFSNYGTWVSISAPGESILTTINGGGYGSVSGTSFSSPIAGGLAALVLSVNPSLTNAQVVQLMEQNADDLGTPGYDPYFGYGRINVYETLLAATSTVPQKDTTPPSVSIVSPFSGAALSGTATVNVSASDNVGISYVNLYINGALYSTDNTNPYSVVWDTTKYANGTYALVAYAYDAAGNVGTSSNVTVSVSNISPVTSDTVPPSVNISSPANGANIKLSKKVTFNVTASDNVGVSRIELWIDGVLKNTVTSQSSLSWTWNTASAAKGAHTVTAKAYDAAGNVGTSSITVYK